MLLVSLGFLLPSFQRESTVQKMAVPSKVFRYHIQHTIQYAELLLLKERKQMFIEYLQSASTLTNISINPVKQVSLCHYKNKEPEIQRGCYLSKNSHLGAKLYLIPRIFVRPQQPCLFCILLTPQAPGFLVRKD